MKKKSGLILVNAFNKSEEMMYQPRRLAEELTALGAEVEVRRADFFPVATGGAEGFRCGLSGFDFIVFLDKDKYILDGLDAAGVRVFARHRDLRRQDDHAYRPCQDGHTHAAHATRAALLRSLRKGQKQHP